VRTLVADVPTWGLALLFVGGAIALAALGFVVVRATDFRSPSTGADTYVSAFGTRASTLFGILLVFVIVSEYSSYQGAQKTVRNEATNLAEIVRNSEAFPAGPRSRIREAVAAYGDEVVGPEWDLMRDGRDSEQASERLDDLQHALASFDPTAESDKAFYGDAVSNFDAVVDARRDRVDAAKEQIPSPLLALLFVGAAVFVLTMLAFSAARDSLLVWLILLLAAVVGAGLFATVVLDYPFSGSLAISNEPFFEGALKGVVRP
jgi:hypothetical protein